MSGAFAVGQLVRCVDDTGDYESDSGRRLLVKNTVYRVSAVWPDRTVEESLSPYSTVSLDEVPESQGWPAVGLPGFDSGRFVAVSATAERWLAALARSVEGDGRAHLERFDLLGTLDREGLVLAGGDRVCGRSPRYVGRIIRGKVTRDQAQKDSSQ